MGTLYRQKGRSVWMMKYYRDGVPIYESSKETSYEKAKAVLKVREGEIAGGGSPTLTVRRLTFAAASAFMIEDYAENGRKTLGPLKYNLETFLVPHFGKKTLVSITSRDVRAYRSKRLEDGAAAGTINRELAAIKRIYTLARQNDLKIIPPHIELLEERNRRKGFFQREQFDAVVAELPEWLRAPMTFAYLTGWRILSEVLTRQWSHVDRKAGVVRLEPEETKNREGRTFTFDVLPELEALIARQWRNRQLGVEWLFPLERRRIWTKDLYPAWHAACEKAGVKGRIPHDFRRTAVRNLVRAGVREQQAMQLTGHLTRSVFDRYDIIDEADLRESVSKLSRWMQR